MMKTLITNQDKIILDKKTTTGFTRFKLGTSGYGMGCCSKA